MWVQLLPGQCDPIKNISLYLNCYSYLKCGQTPPFSLANMNFIGDLPVEFKDLCLVEESLIALSQGFCTIIQMQEKNMEKNNANIDSGYSVCPNMQKGFHGHVIVFPQQPKIVADILPPSIEEITAPMCVIFVGDKPPPSEWLKEKAKPLAVCGNIVCHALIWLKKNNCLYCHIVTNYNLLDSMVPEILLPVHFKHVQPSPNTDDSVAGYNDRPVGGNGDLDQPFKNILISDIGLQASPSDMQVAAMRHL